MLEGKGQILLQADERPDLLQVLPEYNRRLAELGAQLIARRARYLAALQAAAQEYHSRFTGGREQLTLQYQTVSAVTDPFAPVAVLRAQLLERLEQLQSQERLSRSCLTGAHRDDFSALLGELPVKTFGSQGQTRTAVISLKLAERKLLHQARGEMPLLLLDDVLSELDPARQDFVLNQICEGQVFITSCEDTLSVRAGRTLTVQGGRVTAQGD